jgi:hypothetical protein
MVPFEWVAWLAPQPTRMLRRSLLFLPEIELRFLGYLVLRLATTPTALFRLLSKESHEVSYVTKVRNLRIIFKLEQFRRVLPVTRRTKLLEVYTLFSFP